ncbi:hypothetical protein R3751_16495 [Halorubrum distributum]|uniref:hypothetical protein n=1 Tax=Halorubrum distributum TaxID=29283 RepID=UPI0029557722|nr:hypothetical protein [Halorubrum distributum]MDV7351364.1 hypothetical protein [Halorubrum distributum]
MGGGSDDDVDEEIGECEATVGVGGDDESRNSASGEQLSTTFRQEAAIGREARGTEGEGERW